MIGRLKRTTTNDKQTTGILTLHCDGCKSTLELFTLELPYLDNEKSISSIPLSLKWLYNGFKSPLFKLY